MTDNSLAIVPPQNTGYIMPAADIATALHRYQAVKDFIGAVLKSGVDYAPVPGTDKPTLKKPGAEKMSSLFGFTPDFIDIQTVEDWTGQEHGGEAFFYYRQKCNLYRDSKLVASADGSCNSWEKKYRYRQAQRTCPECGKAAIFKSKNKPEWYCWAKKDGCGATFPISDPRIVDQESGQVPNPDVADQVNTILKMAQKRAFVAAILIATNTSDYFTQDLDDFVTAEYREEVIESPAKISAPAPAAPTAPKSTTMTLDEAMMVRSSDGKLYGDRTDKDLQWVANNPKSPADKAQAARMILEHRKAEAVQAAAAKAAQRDMDFPEQTAEGLPF